MEIYNSVNSTNNAANSGNDESIAQQLLDLLAQYREHMGDQDPTQEVTILQKLEAILTNPEYASQIQQICYKNGYRQDSSNWTEHFATFLKHGIKGIQDLLEFHKENPNAPLSQYGNDGGIDFVNEMMTQLTFLLSHHA